MTQKAITLQQLQALSTAYVNAAKQLSSYSPSYEEFSKLLNKIGRTYTIRYNLNDKLEELDGFDLPYGRTIEEYYNSDLVPVRDFDPTGATAMTPVDTNNRKNFYSYPLGKKTIKVTRRNMVYNQAMLSAEGLAEYAMGVFVSQENTYGSWKYATKRQLIGNAIKKVLSATSTTGSTAYAVSTAYNIGDLVYNSNEFGVVYNPIANTNTNTWAQAVAAGDIVLFKFKKVLAKPVDTLTGEAFIQSVKEVIEDTTDESEGYSFNGQALSVPKDRLKLYLLHGIIPCLDVQTLAGAFHQEKLSLEVNVKTIKNFGDAPSSVYAVMIDERGIKLHKDTDEMDDDKNGEGGFRNYYRHMEHTGFISANTVITIWTTA